MDNEQFAKITQSLMASARAYPNCKIANCECNELDNEWKKGCHCMGHWLQMDSWFGKNKWKLDDCDAYSKTGIIKGTPASDIISRLK